MFAAPAIILFAAFLIIPIIYAIYLSFRGFRVSAGGAFGRREETFIGFENYITALTDTEFVAGLGRVLLYGAISIPSVLGLALLFALLLDTPRIRLQSFSRTAIFLPFAVPGVIASLLWGFLYLPSTSPLSDISRALGGGALNFFGTPTLYFSLANIALWSGVGFNMIISTPRSARSPPRSTKPPASTARPSYRLRCASRCPSSPPRSCSRACSPSSGPCSCTANRRPYGRSRPASPARGCR